MIGDRGVTHSSRLKEWGWDPAGCQVSASKWRTHYSLSLTAGQGHRKEMRRCRPSSKQCTWRRWSAWISWRTVKFYIQASSVVSETATATAINQTGDTRGLALPMPLSGCRSSTLSHTKQSFAGTQACIPKQHEAMEPGLTPKAMAPRCGSQGVLINEPEDPTLVTPKQCSWRRGRSHHHSHTDYFLLNMSLCLRKIKRMAHLFEAKWSHRLKKHAQQAEPCTTTLRSGQFGDWKINLVWSSQLMTKKFILSSFLS